MSIAWWRRFSAPTRIALACVDWGAHHPIDILGSLLFAVLWLAAATMVIMLAADGLDRAGSWP